MATEDKKADPRAPIISDWCGFPRYSCPIILWNGHQCPFDTLEKSTILEHISVQHPVVVEMINVTEAATVPPTEDTVPIQSITPATSDTHSIDTKTNTEKKG